MKNEKGEVLKSYAWDKVTQTRYTDNNIVPKKPTLHVEENGDKRLTYELKVAETVKYCDVDKKIPYTTSYNIKCDTQNTKRDAPLSMNNLNVYPDPNNLCNLKVDVTHAAGCPIFQATSIVEFLATHPWIIGVILLTFGVICCFYGGKFFKYVLATVAGGITFLALLVIASAFGAMKVLESNNKQSKSGGDYAACVASFIIAAAFGLLAGWFVKKARRIGSAILGGAAGFFLGFTLYNMVFALWLKHVALLASLCFFGAFLGCYLVYKYDKVIIVQVTAFLGAYSLIRGVSVFAGKFPNEVTMFSELSSGTFQPTGEFYGYLAGFVVLTILGSFHQYHNKYHEHSHDNDDDYKQVKNA